MQKQGGAIVNMTADCANGIPRMAHTAAARAGMQNLTKTAAWEWGPYGVRVNAVAPGFTASSGMEHYDEKAQDWLKGCADNIPLKRMASESEVSSVICFLLSPGASFINGDTIQIDGGGQFGSSHNYLALPEQAMNQVPAYNGFHRYRPPTGFGITE